MLNIRTAEASDFDSIWEIFRAVVAQGDTYVYDPSTTKEQARSIWMGEGIETFVPTFSSVSAWCVLTPGSWLYDIEPVQ